MALEITGGSGSPASQASTQSPQTSAAVGAGSPPPASASSVQPGTADNLLRGPGGGNAGIPLTSTTLPVASLDTATQTATTTPRTGQAAKPQHHPNVVLLVIVVGLVVAALLVTWFTHRSAKNTTDY